ncbi:MAG: hypothetical protein CMP76_07975 [Flavobacterium sp.]|uniref:hypothetical protein n=1 Tax=Flavobacterium sp. TaxID=239 RepID=UPI000C5713DF|nr:hypothetical protein [Flavobacterium sp.]MBF03218.1 hypothetical protein [Flavobacterium sp.]|tara:strand:+ start:318 stop:779 length:462 start_codon:yes stop_codon:yes gene_type:complete
MNTLKIKIPDGHKIGAFNQQTGEITFEPIPKIITERIKTFEDVLKELDIDPQDFHTKTHRLDKDTKAYEQIKLIVKALNEGWTPDWSNSNEYKYFPWFKMGSPSGSGFRFRVYDDWHSYSYVGSRLALKTKELAEHAGKQFEDIYKKLSYAIR